MTTALDWLRLELSTSDPMSAAPAWTDITDKADLRAGISLTRGRSDQYAADTSPGRMTVTLDNTDGSFTPGHASADANLRPQNRLRLTYRDPAVDGNLLTANQASMETSAADFESNTVFGTAAVAAWAQSATRAVDGTKSLLITWPDVAAFTGGSNVGTWAPTVIGRTYTVSAYVWVPTGAPDVRLDALFAGSSAYTSLKDQWVRLSVTFTATGASTYLTVRIAQQAGASGKQAWVDAIQLDEGSSVRTFTTTAPPIRSRFTGYVEEWPVVWPTGGDERATSTVTAYDLISRLSRGRQLGSVIDETYTVTGVIWHYPLSEPAGSQSAGDIAGSTAALAIAQAGTGGTVEFGAGTGPGTDGAAAVVFAPASSSQGKYLTTEGGAGVPSKGFFDPGQGIGITFNTSAAQAQTAIRYADVYGSYLEISLNASGQVVGTWFNAWGGWTGHTSETITSATSFADGHTHTAQLSLGDTAPGSALKLYVDGVQQGSTVTWATFDPIFGTRVWVGGLPTGSMFTGTLSHAVNFNDALTLADAQGVAAANLTGFAGERSDERIARVASWIGVPAEWLNLDVGLTTVTHVGPTGKTGLDLIADLVDSEGGWLWVTGDGELAAYSRSRFYDRTVATALTIAAEDLDEDLEVDLNLADIRNDVTVSRPGGASVRVTDAASVTMFGTFGGSATSLADSNHDAYDRATWILATRANPTTKVPRVTFDLLTATTGARDLELLNARIAVTGLPAQAPTSSLDLRVFGYAEEISSAGWKVTANTAPFLEVHPLTADDPVYGVADADNRAVY